MFLATKSQLAVMASTVPIQGIYIPNIYTYILIFLVILVYPIKLVLLFCWLFLQYSSIDTSYLSVYVMHPFWNKCVQVCRYYLNRWFFESMLYWYRFISVPSYVVGAEHSNIRGFPYDSCKFPAVIVLRLGFWSCKSGWKYSSKMGVVCGSSKYIIVL